MSRAKAGLRRNTEFLLLCAGALPVLLFYVMYLINLGSAITLLNLAVPLGLIVSFTAAHIAIRYLAPGADPAILPIVFILSGIGITFVTRLAPNLAINQVAWLFLSVLAMVLTLFLIRNLDRLSAYKYTIGAIGIFLLILPMLIGVSRGGSRLWLRLLSLIHI